MLKSILFFDEITLWWDKLEFTRDAELYKLYLDGEYVGETDKTHYTFDRLDSAREYAVRIEVFVDGAKITEKEYQLKPNRKKGAWMFHYPLILPSATEIRSIPRRSKRL